jgi:hypothetical protein
MIPQSEGEPIGQTHQGQWRKPQQSPNVRLQSDPVSPHQLKAWQSGGVHVRTVATGSKGSNCGRASKSERHD